MGEKRAYKARKPGGGRKKLKPEFNAGKNLKEQVNAAVSLYDSEMSFSIYQILPQLIELWGLNVQTEVESRKNLAKVSGK